MLILDSSGTERQRLEGCLPGEEFRAELESGLARAAFMRKHWAEAERGYNQTVERYPDSNQTQVSGRRVGAEGFGLGTLNRASFDRQVPAYTNPITGGGDDGGR